MHGSLLQWNRIANDSVLIDTEYLCYVVSILSDTNCPFSRDTFAVHNLDSALFLISNVSLIYLETSPQGYHIVVCRGIGGNSYEYE